MLEEFLVQNKTALVEKWRRRIMESYPGDTAKFLGGQKNRFANPVGDAICRASQEIIDEFLNGMDPDRVSASLDRIVRIRAVQEFSPSQAVAFVYLLKPLIREQLEGCLRESECSRELTSLEDRIDRLALMAFDVYTLCRDSMSEIKVNEAKRKIHKLIDRLNAPGAKDVCGNNAIEDNATDVSKLKDDGGL